MRGVIFILEDLLKYINPMSDDFLLKGVISNIGSILEYINPFSDNFILKNIISGIANILSYINPFSDNFLLKGVMSSIVNILDYINPVSDNFLGKKIIDLLGNLLKRLFVPSDDYFSNLIEEFKALLADKIPYEAYIQLFNNLQDVTEGNSAGLNVNFNNYQIGNKKVATGDNWVKFDLFLKHKQTWFSWCRGFTYIFFIIYNINQFVKFLNKGSGITSIGKSGESEKIYDYGGHKWVR